QDADHSCDIDNTADDDILLCHNRSPTVASEITLRTKPRFSAPARRRAVSFDHLVGAADKRQRDREAERSGSLEIDDQLDLGGLLHGQVSRLFTLENAAYRFVNRLVYSTTAIISISTIASG